MTLVRGSVICAVKMKNKTNDTQENKSQSVSNGESLVESSGESTFQFVDNRPEAFAQWQLKRKKIAYKNHTPIGFNDANLQNVLFDNCKFIDCQFFSTDFARAKMINCYLVNSDVNKGNGTEQLFS